MCNKNLSAWVLAAASANLPAWAQDTPSLPTVSVIAKGYASDSAQGQNPVIRGPKKESVVLLVDGMRLNSAQAQGAIASFMSAGLAQRIEVVKGPASVLYGTGALGGAIDVLLPQAAFDSALALEASSGYDSASRCFNATGVLRTCSESVRGHASTFSEKDG